MKRSIDLKSKLKFSNYILGKVFIVVLSILTLALIYKSSFQSFNLYSMLASLLVISSLAYKSAAYIFSKTKYLTLIDRLEFSLLITLLFGILLEISGNNLFPIAYVMLPIIVLFLGWHAAGLSLVIVSVLVLTQFESTSPPYQIALLLLSTIVLGYFLRGGKFDFDVNLFNKANPKKQLSQNPMPTNFHDQEAESDNIKELRSDINKALVMLSKLIQSHSILFYMKMDDGLYIIADSISNSQEYIDSGQRVSFRGGYLGWVLKTKTPVLITSIKNVRQNLVYYTKDIPVRSLLATPLLMKSEKNIPENKRDVVGILIIDSMKKDVFGEKEKLIVSLISDRISEIIDRYQLSERVKLSNQELNSFYDFTQKLNSSGSVDSVLDQIVDTLDMAMNADFIAVTLYDQEEGTAVLKKISDEDKNHLEDKEIPYTDTLIWLVNEGKNYFTTDDLSVRTRYRSIFGKEIDFALGVKNIKSVLIYPLMEKIADDTDNDAAILGSVVIAREEKMSFDDGEISLAKIICGESAKFIKTWMGHQKTKELALRDGLTGLYNHRHLKEMLTYTVSHCDRYDERSSLILIDVDNLKSINDTYGHRAGDSVLSFVGKVLTESLRKIDIPARYGGDEFAVVLPNTNKRGSMVVAQKIKTNIKNMPFKFDGDEVLITLSIGIATYPENAPDSEVLFEKSDRALYEAKNQGKDKVVHYEDISFEELGT
ncbi:MAG: sensor domain-containing diguanylate cyclase [Thermodesulfobacteriota bacterium]